MTGGYSWLNDTDTCQQCGAQIAIESDAFADTVNLTPDALFMPEQGPVYDFGGTIFELDMRFTWCNPVCFGRWVASAVAIVGLKRAA